MNFIQKNALLVFAVSCAIASCSTAKKAGSDQKELDALTKAMSGHFNSTAQAARDTNYFDITLHMAPIWPDDKANHWLYVEQAVTKNLAKPYRQRVYKVEKLGPDSFQSIVYTLPDDKKVAGWWANPANFDEYKPADLTLRTGCSVFLKKQKDGSFSGATNASDCESSLRGAKYATSKVTIKKSGIVSWDQGFDAENKQVWGATMGGYDFVRIK